MKNRSLLFCLLLPLASLGRAESPGLTALQSWTEPGVTLTAVEHHPAGDFHVPGGTQTIPRMPAFCRVAATLKPSPDSDIKVELWMPQANWNGRFLGTGNGGSAGKIGYGNLASAVARGFAVANTDMGTAPDAELWVGHPERWADFGYRATHEMTVVAKRLIETYYGRAPRFSYFTGASTGGQQALMEAQRYPDDYDGIVAGLPAFNRTHLHAMFVWDWQAVRETPASGFTAEEVEKVTRAAVAAGAGRDGAAPGDPFLTDPRMLTPARFDPGSLAAGAPGGFLNPAQVAALRRIYAGPKNPRTGAPVFTGPPPGSEAQMNLIVERDPSPPAHSYLFRWIFGADFDFRKFDFATHVDESDRRLAPVVTAVSPDLAAFRRHGGKLFMYSGTADAIVPYQDAIAYYEKVMQAQGGLKETQEFFRFFVVPGLAHGGTSPGLTQLSLKTGSGPKDTRDVIGIIQRWVEDGLAPGELLGTRYTPDTPKRIQMQRPLYPYPQFPHYQGGDVNLPSSFAPVEHPFSSPASPAVAAPR